MRRGRAVRTGIVLGWLLLAACRKGAAAGPPPDAPAGSEAFTEMVAVVHIHSSVGDGASSPLELARAARRAGVDALVLTDHFLERASYAPWPFGNAIGVAVSLPSVMAHGIDRYFRDAREAERQVPGCVVLPGLEVTPYARWSGSPLGGTLALTGWHRHLLVLGIENQEALRRLPVAGNRAGGDFGPWSALFLLPAVALGWATRRMARPSYQAARVGAFRLRRRRRPFLECLIVLASSVLLYAGFPYRVERYSSVGADPGTAPFRDLIDAVRRLHGVTLWAHPEAAADKSAPLGIRMVTAPYADLVRLTDADGFGALPEGVKSLLPPGGIWDQALADHLGGTRPHLPLAVAELDEHGAAAGVDFRALQTVFLVRERSRGGLLEALRAGRFYGRWTPERKEPLRLAEFRVEAQGRSALAGGSIAASGPVEIKLVVTGGDGSPVTVRLVRHGEVLWTRRVAPPIDEVIVDRVVRTTWYRIDVEGAYPYRLIGNPITVTAAPEGA